MKKFDYSWIICLMGMLMVFINIGAVANGFSVFLPYVIREHGFTYTQGSNLITIRCLFSFFAMLVVNQYYKRFSLRIGTAFATFLTFLGFAAYAAADSYLMFCLGAALGGFAFSFGAMIAVSLLMNNWFTNNKATAIGICSAGSGIATIVLPPVTTMLIENISLSAAFGIESAFFLACSIIMYIVVKDHPISEHAKDAAEGCSEDEDRCEKRRCEERRYEERRYEERRYEERQDKAWRHDAEAPSGSYDADANPRAAISVPVWALMICASLLIGMIANTGVTHLAALYSADGYEAMTTALFISIMGIVLTVGKIAYGSMSDQFGGLKATALFSFILIIGHVLCVMTYTQSLAIGVVSAVLTGFGWPIGTIGPSIWAGDLASSEEYAKALQVFQLGYTAGALVFAGVPGLMADHSGGAYNSSYALMGVMLIVFTAIIIAAYKIHKNSIKTDNMILGSKAPSIDQ